MVGNAVPVSMAYILANKIMQDIVIQNNKITIQEKITVNV